MLDISYHIMYYHWAVLAGFLCLSCTILFVVIGVSHQILYLYYLHWDTVNPLSNHILLKTLLVNFQLLSLVTICRI